MVFSAFASGEWHRIEPFVSGEHAVHQSLVPPVTLRGWAPLLGVLKFIAHGLKDFELTVEAQIATADRVVSRFSGRAKNLGPFGIVPPSGKHVAVTGMLESRFERSPAGGIVAVESWLEVNALEIALWTNAATWQDPVRHVMS